MSKAKRDSYKGKRRMSDGRKSKLPLFMGLGGAMILIIAAFLSFQNKSPAPVPEVSGSPNLKVDKEVVDLGDVKLGTPVEVSFTITNTGDQALSFTETPYIEVKEGC